MVEGMSVVVNVVGFNEYGEVMYFRVVHNLKIGVTPFPSIGPRKANNNNMHVWYAERV